MLPSPLSCGPVGQKFGMVPIILSVQDFPLRGNSACMVLHIDHENSLIAVPILILPQPMGVLLCLDGFDEFIKNSWLHSAVKLKIVSRYVRDHISFGDDLFHFFNFGELPSEQRFKTPFLRGDPSILKTERPPVTRVRSNDYCADAMRPTCRRTLPRERVRSLALNGPERVACQCLLLGVEQTFRAGGQTSESDPTATFDAAEQSYAYPAAFG
jgi:hypothetical protein